MSKNKQQYLAGIHLTSESMFSDYEECTYVTNDAILSDFLKNIQFSFEANETSKKIAIPSEQGIFEISVTVGSGYNDLLLGLVACDSGSPHPSLKEIDSEGLYEVCGEVYEGEVY